MFGIFGWILVWCFELFWGHRTPILNPWNGVRRSLRLTTSRAFFSTFLRISSAKPCDFIQKCCQIESLTMLITLRLFTNGLQMFNEPFKNFSKPWSDARESGWPTSSCRSSCTWSIHKQWQHSENMQINLVLIGFKWSEIPIAVKVKTHHKHSCKATASSRREVPMQPNLNSNVF